MDGQRICLNRIISGHTLELAKVFYVFSNENCINEKIKEYTFDAKLKPIIKTIEKGFNKDFDINYQEENINPYSYDCDNNNVVVCFSGGKDSTSAAIKMKNEGYNVFLYYIQGINKSFPDELIRAKNIAQQLKLPLHIEKVNLKGKTTFHDNPVKNQLIASMALDWSANNNISTKIVFGDFTTDNVNNSSFLEAWSDTQEMWLAHKEFVRHYIPSYEIIIPFSNYIETMDIISTQPLLMNMIQGCVLPHRFREITKKKNENKFNVKLQPHRCGSCWKCCVEYIHYADTGVNKYNKDFYAHCLDILTKKMSVLHPQISDYDLNCVYRTFLYSELKETQYYKDIKK